MCNSFLGINILQLGLEQQFFPPSKYNVTDMSGPFCLGVKLFTHPPFQRIGTFFSEILALTPSLHVADMFNYTHYNHTWALWELCGCRLAFQRCAGTACTLLLESKDLGNIIIYTRSSGLKGSMCFVTNASD